MEISNLDTSDALAYLASELLDRYNNVQNTTERFEIIQDFLRRWEAHYETLLLTQNQSFEFENGLDWFNVSQPLTMSSLKGKLVILDFFTFCCMNCVHIFPDLSNLEKQFSTECGLVVIGVHSPKFSNEKCVNSISNCIERYALKHPVVNDPNLCFWNILGVRCWPTLVIIAPNGSPMLMLMGEGHGQFLNDFIGRALQFFKQRNELTSAPIEFQSSTTKSAEAVNNLRFPTKIASDGDSCYAIVDSGNHRVLVVNQIGEILYKIGCGLPGFVDGDITKAHFNSPQGAAFFEKNILIVADTGNHVIRQINLKKRTIDTLAGTGQRGRDLLGGNLGRSQVMNSPWDVAVFRTRDMDMSFHIDEQTIAEKAIVLISMAGNNQIWGYFPEGMIWWKYRKFDPQICVRLMGNGTEENRNNSYPQNAAFAQPTGLAISDDTLFIADSESSSIRKASLVDGKVTSVVGGDKNPQNLFAYGDIDGKQYEAKLQHPLAVAYCHRNKKLYVADTYNHKIKVIHLEENHIETLPIEKIFNEPAGLCIDPCGQFLLVADTNNHEIWKIDLQTHQANRFHLSAQTFEKNPSYCPAVLSKSLPPTRFTLIKHFHLYRVKQLKLLIQFELNDSLQFATNAKQSWSMDSSKSTLKSLSKNGYLQDNKLCLDLKKANRKSDEEILTHNELCLHFDLNLCSNTCCIPKSFNLLIKDINKHLERVRSTELIREPSQECLIMIHLSLDNIVLS